MDETGSSSPKLWVLVSFLTILAVAILSVTQWPLFPYFLDSAYHLAVIQDFKEAGGSVLHDFWERAPEGRAHLYPPLFHLLWVPIAKLGVPPFLMAKLWSWAALPFLLVVAWRVLSRITTARRTSLMVLALASPYSFFLSAVNYLPATLVLAAALGLLLALFKKRPLAGGILLGLSFWLHAGLPWLLALGLILYAFLAPDARKTAAAALGIGLLVGSPWLFHLLRHLNLLQFQPRGEERMLETPVLLFGLGIAGFFIAWRRRGPLDRLLMAMAIGFLPMAIGYRFRFFSAQGLFPWLLLAGVALDGLVGRIKRSGFIVAGLAWVLLFAPTVHWSAQGIRWVWADTTLSVLAGRPQVVPRATGQMVFNPRFMTPLALLVEEHSQPEELLYCNLAYVGGIMNVLTRRATTSEMLRETADRPQEEQITQASIILWVKEPSDRKSPRLEETASTYGLEPIAETQIAYLYRNPRADGRRRVARAVMPWWAGLLCAGIAVGVAAGDLRRCRCHSRSR